MKNLINKLAFLTFFCSLLIITLIIIYVFFINPAPDKSLKEEQMGKLWEERWGSKQDLSSVRNLSAYYLKEGKWEEGRRLLEEAIKIYPRDPALRFNLALVYWAENKLEDSWKELEILRKTYPYYPNLYYMRGLILEKKGNRDLAYKEFMEEINRNPGNIGAWEKIKNYPLPEEKVEVKRKDRLK